MRGKGDSARANRFSSFGFGAENDIAEDTEDDATSSVEAGIFGSIPVYVTGFDKSRDCVAALAPEHRPANRYTDILPYDVTRVRLDGGDDDYINANLVNYGESYDGAQCC